jgi:hypothetical protein
MSDEQDGNTAPALLGVSMAEVPQLSDREKALVEQAYRRGYRAGWLACVQAFASLVWDARLPFKTAHLKAWDFWEVGGRLFSWHVDGDWSKIELPPVLNKWHADAFSDRLTTARAKPRRS